MCVKRSPNCRSVCLAAGAVGSAKASTDPFSSDGYNPSTGLLNLPYSQLDTSILFYQESGGRVRAIEPSATLSVHGSGGENLSLNLTADSVTGATPNGAAPSDQVQTFVTPLKATGSTATVTSASGGSTVIHLPPTPGQIASAALGRQYTVAPNTLPVDRGFFDDRYAGNFSWSQPLGPITLVGFGGGYSTEHDYRAITANAQHRAILQRQQHDAEPVGQFRGRFLLALWRRADAAGLDDGTMETDL